jgi:hypothetical protein
VSVTSHNLVQQHQIVMMLIFVRFDHATRTLSKSTMEYDHSAFSRLFLMARLQSQWRHKSQQIWLLVDP